MQEPMVSVVIPTYKADCKLQRAINSALCQTYSNIEIIVVDDNTPETPDRKKTELLMDRYKNNPKVIYVKHEINKNGSAARNTGIRVAKGDYITFLDDDDFYLPERIENSLEKIGEYDGIITDVVFITNKKVFNYLHIQKWNDLLSAILVDDNFLGTGSNLFIRKSVLSKMGMFDETLVRNQDYEFIIRFAKNGFSFGIINIPLVVKDETLKKNVPAYKKMKLIKQSLYEKYIDDIKKTNQERDISISIHRMLMFNALTNRDREGIQNEKLKLIELGQHFSIKEKINYFLMMADKTGLYAKFKFIIKQWMFEMKNKKICVKIKKYLKYLDSVGFGL